MENLDINDEEHLLSSEEDERERLKEDLEFFFLDPIKKFKKRKQIPYKFILQILKMVFVFIEVSNFLGFSKFLNFSC